MQEIIIKYRAEVAQFKSELDDLKRKMGVLESDTARSTKNMSSEFSKLAKVAGALFALDKVKDYIGSLVSATAESQKFAAILTTALGSKSAGQKALAELSQFAAKTPFQLNELTESFIKLVNRGFKPTQAEMTKLGDLAASQGKSFNQLTEAILDAMTGEGERLKEFGVRMTQSGDKVSLSFKGMTTTVNKNDEAIRNAIMSFGAMEGVAGSMASVSATTGGQLSNLADSTDRAAKNMGNKLAPAINGVISAVSQLVSNFNDLMEGSTPLADGLRIEQSMFNSITDAITDANTPTDVRKLLINQINTEYKEYLPSLITEKSSIEDIANAQKAANTEFEKRIALTAREELLTDNIRKQTEELKFQAEILAKGTSKGGSFAVVAMVIDKLTGSKTVRSTQALKDSKEKIIELRQEYEKLMDVTTRIAKDAGVSDLELATGKTTIQSNQATTDSKSLMPISVKQKNDIDKARQSVLQKELADLKIHSANIKEQSVERVNAEIKILEKERDVKLVNWKLTAGERRDIEADTYTKIIALTQSFIDKQNTIEAKAAEDLKKQNEKNLTEDTKETLDNIDIGTAQQKEGLRKKLKNDEDYQLESAKTELNGLELKKQFLEASGQDTLEIEAQIAEKKGEIAEKSTAKDKEELEKRLKLFNEFVSASSQLINSAFEFERTINQNKADELTAQEKEELDALDRKFGVKKKVETAYEREKREIEEKFAKEQAELKHKQAVLDKEQALFNIAVDTAKAIAKSVAESPATFGLPWSAFAAGVGIAQAAVVAARKIPEFEKGGLIKGGQQVIQVNEKGQEFIANAQATRKYSGYLEAMNKGRFEEMITTPRVLDLINKAQHHREQMNERERKALKQIIKAELDDTGLRHDIQRNKTVKLDSDTVRQLIKGLRPGNDRFTP